MFVAINLGRTCEDESETFSFLPLKDITRAYDIGLPKRVVIFFAVDPSEFSRKMIHIIIVLPKYTLKLPVIRHVSADVILISLMLKIALPYLVASFF